MLTALPAMKNYSSTTAPHRTLTPDEGGIYAFIRILLLIIKTTFTFPDGETSACKAGKAVLKVYKYIYSIQGEK